MARVNSVFGLVSVIIVAVANVPTTWAQSDEVPRRLRERVSRTQFDEGFPWSAAGSESENKITAGDGATGDSFGFSVAISGDTAIITARRDDDNGENSGSAYVFQRDEGGMNNWGRVFKLRANDGAANDRFGRSVAIDGDTVIVGAYLDDDDGEESGSAYVFQRDAGGGGGSWRQVTKITASDGATEDWFGASVAISGDTAIVGANGDDDNGSKSGSVYVYQRDEGGVDNWGEVIKIIASDGAADAVFGMSVAISGDTAIVGAGGDGENGLNSGSAYVYQRDAGGTDNWGEVAKITASDGAIRDTFGGAVAISSDTVVVGAQQQSFSRTGLAYVFRRDEGGIDNWGEVTRIAASDGDDGDNFGVSVAIRGNTLIVGAYDAWIGDVIAAGAVYVYQRDKGGLHNWGEVSKITASDGAIRDQFGFSVAISGVAAIVGAPGPFGKDADVSGSAYAYSGFIPSPPVPSASAWGAAVMALLVAGAGAVGIHRRRVQRL